MRFFLTTNGVGAGLVICELHLRELADYQFHGGSLEVVPVDVRESGGVVPIECTICKTVYSPNNTCERCSVPLHPRWPAVYCSDECALEDA